MWSHKGKDGQTLVVEDLETPQAEFVQVERKRRQISAQRTVGLALAGLTFLVVTASCLRGQIDSTSVEATAANSAHYAVRSLLSQSVVHWTGTSETVEKLLETSISHTSALIIVIAGPGKPERRDASTPFLSVGPGVILPVDCMNSAAQAVEMVTGRRLYPIRIETMDLIPYAGFMSGVRRPYVIWEVSTGRVVVDHVLVKQLWAQPRVQHMTHLLSTFLFNNLAQALAAVGSIHPSGAGNALPSLSSLMGPALSAAVAAAFGAAPPLWFCIVCPAVLGLLAPLLINIGLNQLAGYLCTHFSLPDDQCFDILLGALGVSFILSLASAIPIFMVCRLQDCSHRGNVTVGPLVAAGGASSGMVLSTSTRSCHMAQWLSTWRWW